MDFLCALWPGSATVWFGDTPVWGFATGEGHDRWVHPPEECGRDNVPVPAVEGRSRMWNGVVESRSSRMQPEIGSRHPCHSDEISRKTISNRGTRQFEGAHVVTLSPELQRLVLPLAARSQTATRRGEGDLLCRLKHFPTGCSAHNANGPRKAGSQDVRRLVMLSIVWFVDGTVIETGSFSPWHLRSGCVLTVRALQSFPTPAPKSST